MLGEIPTTADLGNTNTVPQMDEEGFGFDGTQVPYWLGGTQGEIQQAVTSVGPVMVPANTPANNAGAAGMPYVPDVNIEDFFNGNDPTFYGTTTPALATPAPKKNNTMLYVIGGLAAYFLFVK